MSIDVPKRRPIAQARSRENQTHIVFVHPAQFLVTGPDGADLANALVGDRLQIPRNKTRKLIPTQEVFYFDLPRRGITSPDQSSVPLAATPDGR